MNDGLTSWLPALLDGAKLTIGLTVVSMAVALVLGLVLALCRLNSRRWYLYWPATVFVEIIRGTPLLLQLFYVYFVLPFIGIRLSPFTAGVIALSINYGAYLSEVYRAGIGAVDRSQWEAAEALAMSPTLAMRRVILPQAIRIIIPPVGNYFVSLFKDTALASTIGLSELLFAGRLLASQNYEYLRLFTIVFVLYFLISYPVMLGVRWLEKRTSLQRSRPRRRVLVAASTDNRMQPEAS
jgi:polar amino acid transport system permease protein